MTVVIWEMVSRLSMHGTIQHSQTLNVLEVPRITDKLTISLSTSHRLLAGKSTVKIAPFPVTSWYRYKIHKVPRALTGCFGIDL